MHLYPLLQEDRLCLTCTCKCVQLMITAPGLVEVVDLMLQFSVPHSCKIFYIIEASRQMHVHVYMCMHVQWLHTKYMYMCMWLREAM